MDQSVLGDIMCFLYTFMYVACTCMQICCALGITKLDPILSCIDGHHKLVRWRLITHGGIDGFSRLIVYLHCSDNNTAETVLQLFKKAMQTYGLPSRVRTDQGLENIEVAKLMLAERGVDRGTVLVGASVHNQRIERLWRDLYSAVIQLYHRLFYHLEEIGLLDPLNENHIYALHYVFLPRINRAMEEFTKGWNQHSITGCEGLSPLQLYTKEMVKIRQTSLPAYDFFQPVNDSYGSEDEDFVPSNEDNTVTIPRVQVELTEQQKLKLATEINPTAESDYHGIDLYMNTLQIVQDQDDD